MPVLRQQEGAQRSQRIHNGHYSENATTFVSRRVLCVIEETLQPASAAMSTVWHILCSTVFCRPLITLTLNTLL